MVSRAAGTDQSGTDEGKNNQQDNFAHWRSTLYSDRRDDHRQWDQARRSESTTGCKARSCAITTIDTSLRTA